MQFKLALTAARLRFWRIDSARSKETIKANVNASFAEKKRKIEQAEMELLSIPKESWNLKRLCRKYDVAPSALRYRIRHNATLTKSYQERQADRTRSAQQTNRVLCDQVEATLFQHIICMAELGFACTSEDVKELALRVAKELGVTHTARGQPFQASDGWLKRFKARYPGLRHRRLRDFESMRASGMNPVMVRKYFSLLQWAYYEAERRSQNSKPFSSSRVHNLDETGFDRGLADNSWGLVSSDMHAPRRVQIGMSYHVTMVNLISADGSAKPPFFIMNGRKMPACTEGKTTADGRLLGVGRDAAWAIQESGFLTQELWENRVAPFICAHIRANADPQDWHVLVLDGVSSHTMSPKAMKCFLQHKILVLKMPAHTSADLQPLDKSVFHPVKEQVRSQIRKYTLDTGQRTLDQWELPQLLETAWWKAAAEGTVKAGFRKCGIYPLNTNWVHENDDKLFTSIPFMLYRDRRQMEDDLCVTALGPSMHAPSVTAFHIILSMLPSTVHAACSCASKCFRSEVQYYCARTSFGSEPKRAPNASTSESAQDTPPVNNASTDGHQGGHGDGLTTAGSDLPQLSEADSSALGNTTSAKPNIIEKSLSMMEAACLPLVQERILSERALLAKLTKTIADELKVDHTLAEKAIISSCELSSSVLRHLKTPLAIHASLQGTLAKQSERTAAHRRKRTNAVGESQSEPALLNGETRIERLEMYDAQRTEEAERKRKNRQKICDKFIRESGLVQLLHHAQVITWNANDAEAFAGKRLLNKQDLLRYIELRQLRETVKKVTGKAPASCKRDELVTVLESICSPQDTHDTSATQIQQSQIPVIQSSDTRELGMYWLYCHDAVLTLNDGMLAGQTRERRRASRTHLNRDFEVSDSEHSEVLLSESDDLDHSETTSPSSQTEIKNHTSESADLVAVAAPSYRSWKMLLDHASVKGLYPIPPTSTRALELVQQLTDRANQIVGAHIAFNWDVGWSIGQIRWNSTSKKYNCEVQYEGEEFHRVHRLAHDTYDLGEHAKTGAWCLLDCIQVTSPLSA